MSKTKTAAGYAWALLAVPFMVVLMMASQSIYEGTFEKMGLKVTDRISGGKVIHITPRDGYAVHQHRPVFDGLFGEVRSGFVQIDFIADERLPPLIEEEIDFDLDGTSDFIVGIDTATNDYRLIPKTGAVGELTPEGVYVLEKRRTVRVKIKR